MEDLKTPYQLFKYECGPGWYPLVEEAKRLVDEWNETHADGENSWGGENLEFSQVKEKWGLLCIYLNFYPDDIYEKIRDIEDRSRYICEECGSSENVTTESTHHWIMTLCHNCRDKELMRWQSIYKKTNTIK